jgi:hypothetical protein
MSPQAASSSASAASRVSYARSDSYCVPGGEEHGVDALEDSICIDIFSPVRDEYLD